MLIGIDPGATGGIAWRHEYCDAKVEKMPPTIQEIIELLTHIVSTERATCYLEDVGYHRQGNNAGTSAKFARHCGHLEAILVALQIPTVPVAPKKWQKIFGALPDDKTQRKNAIKARMQQRHPALKVRLWGADALGILYYAEQQEWKR